MKKSSKRNLLVEPLLRFETFDAILRWIPQNTEVFVEYRRPTGADPHFVVYKSFAPPPYPKVYEEWIGVHSPDVRLGTGAEAEGWLKRQRKMSAVRVVRKKRSIRFTPVFFEGVLTYGKEVWGW